MNPCYQPFIDEIRKRDEILCEKSKDICMLVDACDIVLEALLETGADIGFKAETAFLSKLRAVGCDGMVDDFIDSKYRNEDCGSDPSEKDAMWEERE